MKEIEEVEIVESPRFSFDYWNIWEFIKGRKKMAITGLAIILAYIISDSAVVALVAGPVVEMIYSVIEYYIKQ